MNQTEIPIYAQDLMRILNYKSSNTLYLAIKRGAVPPPDIQINQKIRFWYRSTLFKAGILEKLHSEPILLPNPKKTIDAFQKKTVDAVKLEKYQSNVLNIYSHLKAIELCMDELKMAIDDQI